MPLSQVLLPIATVLALSITVTIRRINRWAAHRTGRMVLIDVIVIAIFAFVVVAVGLYLLGR